MKSKVIAFLCCAATGLLTTAASAAQTGVLIHRGAQTEVLGTATPVRNVVLDRGSATPRGSGLPAYAESGSAGSSELRAGRTLWLLDDSGMQLKACRLTVTSHIGERRIRCFAHRLSD